MTDVNQAAERLTAFLEEVDRSVPGWEELPTATLVGDAARVRCGDIRAVLTDRTRAWDRIAELEARLGELIGSREAIAAVSFERLQRIKAFEAEREWRAAQTDRGGPDLIWAIGGADGYIMVNVSEEAARREAEKWPDRVALWAERTAWRDAAIEEPKP